jgi:hypothetical protein
VIDSKIDYLSRRIFTRRDSNDTKRLDLDEYLYYPVSDQIEYFDARERTRRYSVAQNEFSPVIADSGL